MAEAQAILSKTFIVSLHPSRWIQKQHYEIGCDYFLLILFISPYVITLLANLALNKSYKWYSAIK